VDARILSMRMNRGWAGVHVEAPPLCLAGAISAMRAGRIYLEHVKRR
jgi:hypothetical protein